MSKNTKIILGIFVGLFIVTALTFVGLFVYWQYYLKPIPKKVLTEKEEIKAAVIEPTGIYPQPFGDSGEIMTMGLNSQIFEPLVALDNDFKLKPILAESWNNPDDLTWRISLRKNVKFHNGDEFDAEDVKVNFETAKENQWVACQGLDPISEVKIIDKYTVELKTAEPYPILLNKLIGIFILPKKLVENNDLEKYIGSGPYKLADYKQGEEMILERNNSYWGEKSKVQKIRYKFYFDDKQATEWLTKGEVDVTDGLKPVKEVEELKKNSNYKAISFNDYYVYDMIFNVAPSSSSYVEGVNSNPMKDRRVREAIYRGINIDELIEESELGFAIAQSQTVPKVTFGYNPNIKRLEYNPEKAKELLKEAGYPNGFGFIVDVPPTRKDTGENISKQLEKIGIKIKVNVMEDPGAGLKKAHDGDFICIIIGEGSESGDASDVLDALAYSEGSDNFGKYLNPEVDALIEQARKTSDQTKRKKILGETLEKYSNDIATIPLYTDTFTYFTNNDIELTWDRTGVAKGTNIAGIKEVLEKPTFLQFVKNLMS